MVFPSIEGALCYGMYSDFDEFIDDPLLASSLCVGYDGAAGTATTPRRHIPNDAEATTTDRSKMSCLLDDPEEDAATAATAAVGNDDSDADHHDHFQDELAAFGRFAILSSSRNDDDYDDDEATTASSSPSSAASCSSACHHKKTHHHNNHHILKYNIMAQMQQHLPVAKRGESFWLQYSLVQDGASIPLLLNKIQDLDATVLAIETVDGEIFGAFCSQSWKVAPDWYGNGESFLWRQQKEEEELQEESSSLSSQPKELSSCRTVSTCSTSSIATVASSSSSSHPEEEEDEQREIEMIDKGPKELTVSSQQEQERQSQTRRHHHQQPKLEVFKFAFQNRNIQQCHNDQIMIGGGTRGSDPKWGYGISLDQDLLRGSTCPCLTFESPSLSYNHSDGSIFEVRNLEVWALTPCVSIEEAERSQDRKRHYHWLASTTNSQFKPRAMSLSLSSTAVTQYSTTNNHSKKKQQQPRQRYH